jgi:hypothetical protein
MFLLGERSGLNPPLTAERRGGFRWKLLHSVALFKLPRNQNRTPEFIVMGANVFFLKSQAQL